MFKIHVGNISYQTPQRAIEKLFSTYGIVDEVIYVKDDKTGQPRGFAFVLMSNESQGMSAIAELNGRKVNGRPLEVTAASGRKVKETKPVARPESTRRPSRRGTRGARANATSRRPNRRNQSGEE